MNLIETINNKLKSQTVPSSVILSRFMMLDESSRNSYTYTDPKYIPFYYYLGSQIQPKNFCEFGFKLGLCSGVFFLGCHSVENFLAFQHVSNEYYSSRLGVRNIKQFYKKSFQLHVGEISDSNFQDKFHAHDWDLISINDQVSYDQHMAYLNLSWEKLNEGGMIIMDYINSHKAAAKSYNDFCKLVRREPIFFKSKYKVGLIQK